MWKTIRWFSVSSTDYIESFSVEVDGTQIYTDIPTGLSATVNYRYVDISSYGEKITIFDMKPNAKSFRMYINYLHPRFEDSYGS